ncbi:Elongin-B [Camelus dromedarius]|uniref:Elongin-B n=1 Tax=Camelus dromedarius TaxID=9838 RepID=A0A5N4CCL0_CAMDR|nr:Elongin-B [Camelus dromedarius]
MDVFLMIRRNKTTIFTEARESSTVLELKRIIEGILKQPRAAEPVQGRPAMIKVVISNYFHFNDDSDKLKDY